LRVFRHTHEVSADAAGAVVAVGNFDGVHLGHQAVIRAARDQAAAEGRPSAVLTFEPHPREVFQPGNPPFRLSPLRPKTRAIEAIGIDALFVLHFDLAFAAKSAEEFATELLAKSLQARHVVVGYDFVFGRGRKGNATLLAELGRTLGYRVTAIPPVRGPHDEIYSSTRIREYLVAGQPRRAAELLGRPWEIEGRVEHGDERGRALGFPTANLLLGDYLRPAFGVYAVKAGVDQGADTRWHPGVANLGRRPTVVGTVEQLEVHLFDFSGDLYGRHLRVELIEFLRPEKKFDGLEALRAQIAEDAARARDILAAAAVGSG
jgi:riboflavin kinase/FMN adenylyltransferase